MCVAWVRTGKAFVGERVVEGVFVGNVDEGVAVELGRG